MRDLLLWINPSRDLMRFRIRAEGREQSLRLQARLGAGGRGSLGPVCLPPTLKLGELPRVSKIRSPQ